MYKRLIPSILIKDGRLVKGRTFENYKDAGNPSTTTRAHNAQGADELSVCDIQCSKNNTEPDFETLEKIAEEAFMPLTFFGGINSLERAEKAMMVGADKLGLNTAALDQPDLIDDLSHRYGAQAVVLGLDLQKTDDSFKIFDHRTREVVDKDPLAWIDEAIDRGCGELKLTAVHYEGSQECLDLEMFDYVRENVNVPVILEGGAGSLNDLEQAYKHGVDAIALGAMLVFSDSNLVKIQQHMRSQNIQLRS